MHGGARQVKATRFRVSDRVRLSSDDLNLLAKAQLRLEGVVPRNRERVEVWSAGLKRKRAYGRVIDGEFVVVLAGPIDPVGDEAIRAAMRPVPRRGDS